MLLKEIGRKIAQAFRLARAADEKVASSIAAALDAKAEQIDEEKHPKRASGMEPGKMSDLRTGMLETNVKTGAPAEENASSLHRVRTQNRK